MQSGQQTVDLRYFSLAALRFVLPDPETTPFAEVAAEYDSGAEVEPVEALDALSPGECPSDGVRSLRRALELTIERTLGPAKTVAVQTGGGLDSGALLALVHEWAARHGRSYFAISIDFEGEGDDRPYLRSLQARLGCRVVRIAPADGARFAWTFESGIDASPLLWPMAPIELAAHARAKEEGADLVVGGSGGDHLFDGQPRALAELAREGQLLTAWRSVRVLRGFDRPRWPAFSWLARPLVSSMLPPTFRAHFARSPPVRAPEWVGPVLRGAATAEEQRRRQLTKETLLGRSLGAVSVRSAKIRRVASRGRHQMEVATGLSRAHPFLDPALERFMLRVPAHWLLAGGIRRGLFREAVRDIVPRELYFRQDKAYFETAIVECVEASGGFARLRPFANARRMASLGLIESVPFRSEFEKLVANPTNKRLWPRVWPVLALEAFLCSYFNGGT